PRTSKPDFSPICPRGSGSARVCGGSCADASVFLGFVGSATPSRRPERALTEAEHVQHTTFSLECVRELVHTGTPEFAKAAFEPEGGAQHHDEPGERHEKTDGGRQRDGEH